MTRAQFLDAIASPSPYPSQWVSESVIDSFKSGDSYRISELCELGLKGTKVLTPRPSKLISHCTVSIITVTDYLSNWNSCFHLLFKSK